MCTLRVYWLVNRRSQPMIKHGKRRRLSFSMRKGDGSREGEVLMSRLEHEGAGEADFEENPGEGVGRGWSGRSVVVEGN